MIIITNQLSSKFIYHFLYIQKHIIVFIVVTMLIFMKYNKNRVVDNEKQPKQSKTMRDN